MTTQRGPKRKKPASQFDKEAVDSNGKTIVEAKTALARAEAKGRAGGGSVEQSAKAQKNARTPQTKARHERRASSKTGEALADDQETSTGASLELEQEFQLQMKRVSFVVRLEVDEHGQLGPIKIFEAQQDNPKEKRLNNLDGEGLVAFIKECINPATGAEHLSVGTPLAQNVITSPPEPFNFTSGIMISDVRVFRAGVSDATASILNCEEVFVVEARFRLRGSAVPSPGAEGMMKVYVSEVTSGKSQLLTTCKAILTYDELEYAVLAEAPGLPPGIYRLFTHITLNTPIRVVGYHDGPVIRVLIPA
jgi:hypothetical protein